MPKKKAAKVKPITPATALLGRLIASEWFESWYEQAQNDVVRYPGGLRRYETKWLPQLEQQLAKETAAAEQHRLTTPTDLLTHSHEVD